MAASFELRNVREVFTLRTFGAEVSFSTKAWKVFKSGATHFKTKSISPESIQHSRTKACARANFLNVKRPNSTWFTRRPGDFVWRRFKDLFAIERDRSLQ